MSKRSGEQPTTPKDFAQTTPAQASPDTGPWLLTAINDMKASIARVEATAVAAQAQLQRIQDDLRDVKKEVEGHGRWMHTLKVILAVIGGFIALVTTVVVAPWVKSKFFPGP